MSTAKKIWLIVGASLTLLGCIIFFGVIALLNFDFTNLSTNKYQTNLHEIDSDYKSISIISDTADIVFVASENGKALVECYEHENEKHSVTLNNDTLIIEAVNTKKWYENVGINFGSPKITVYIPSGEYDSLSIKESTGDINIPDDFKFEKIDIAVSTGDVALSSSATDTIKISSSTGDITISDVSAASLDLSATTGKISLSDIVSGDDVSLVVSTGKTVLTNVECKNLTSSGSTGDISLNSVIAMESFSITRSTGDVTFDGSNAEKILVKTDTGDVNGWLLSDKIFITKTDTGDINVPSSTTGGKCEVTTDTGDINLRIQK